MADDKDFEKDPLLMDHNYDGIRELDNPLPFWWLATFLGAIIFSFFYWVHYHNGGNGLSSSDQLAQDMARIQKSQKVASDKQPEVTNAQILALVKDAKAMAGAKKEFGLKCAACHGNAGEGLIGPNLTDDYWIHGNGQARDIVNMIRRGVVEKGMPAWAASIDPTKINAIAAYIMSLYGSSPANAKKPEGKKVKVEGV